MLTVTQIILLLETSKGKQVTIGEDTLDLVHNVQTLISMGYIQALGRELHCTTKGGNLVKKIEVLTET